ncbi:glycoside hydrolase family 15 protein [Alteribacter natronophilus]|uniref:glycoside hydrolase family 15 protein n=1 Tax=Alteribacter natronophilus TaxID=2583810 RepID=UPI00110F0DD3|nr:glycoside hydrolase family 15 protein [Alteribacter natronophilus]TMW71072.1 hypothetical protein FGB90_13975 [Alteribacter natronophilus]
MVKTDGKIRGKLTSPIIGGIERFPGDIYIEGNPWKLTTLWLAQYYQAMDRHEEANELIDWVGEFTPDLGLIPEQVDKFSGEPAWVMPLTWSHAMYVLAVREGKQER